MTLLHVHFHVRNQQAFQRVLEGSSTRGQSSASVGVSTSGGKSWTRSNTLSSIMSCDVNARDQLGRTVLHLACSSVESSSLEYTRLLLAHPAININILDTENHWTPLHRALYSGNLAAAVLLLKRADLDTSLKDIEGYTAFDLYNSTLKSTNLSAEYSGPGDLFTWGANRNAALGLGDGDDRINPDQVIIPRRDSTPISDTMNIEARFKPIQVTHVSMSKLHTVVVTSESHDNIRVCGFGSGGRLGPSQHTQYSLIPLASFSHTVVSVATGQDHTLILTKTGEVFSFGLNRFSQLGYSVESSSMGGRLEEPIQVSPRKIGNLKKEFVKGIAASKVASACWTDKEVYTWGTNYGQLGYSRVSTPVQIMPRKVTGIIQPIISLSMTDTAMACLLENGEVACIWNDGVFKINFPTQSFPSEISVYRPPQAVRGPHVVKLTSCDDQFAALSSNGEVFTFSLPSSSDGETSSNKGGFLIKPQRVWALRKQFSGVRDVALGSDGSIIICTNSGHVFMRSRNVKAGQGNNVKAYKFQRVPYIQRVVKVYANSTGAFGALRVDFKPRPIIPVGLSLTQDVASIQPYLHSRQPPRGLASVLPLVETVLEDDSVSPSLENNEEGDDATISRDLVTLSGIIGLADNNKQDSVSHDIPSARCAPPSGADIIVTLRSGLEIPVHKTVLFARCPTLSQVFLGSAVVQDKDHRIAIKRVGNGHSDSKQSGLPRVEFLNCTPMAVLLLLNYLYSDQVVAVWDRRIGMAVESHWILSKVSVLHVKCELQILARMLDLPFLGQAVESPSKRDPMPSMITHFERLFNDSQKEALSVKSSYHAAPDVVLQLSDREVFCHSAVLRARSPLFGSFFGDEDWTAKRRDENGVIRFNLKHLTWRIMQYVLRFMCCGEEAGLFTVLVAESTRSVDDVLSLIFDSMAAANELLLDKLTLICSADIIKHLSISNSCYILTDATHYNATALVESVQDYMAANLEILLEGRMLDDLSPHVVKQLSEFVRKQQEEKSPISRSNRLAEIALEKHADWLAMQDIPQPIVRTNRSSYKDCPKLSPSGPTRRRRPSTFGSPSTSPSIRPNLVSRPPTTSAPSGDEIFLMDDAEIVPVLDLNSSQPMSRQTESDGSQGRPTPWKQIAATPRTDLKAIIAETEVKKAKFTTPAPIAMPEQNAMQPLPISGSPRTSGTPWKIPISASSAKPSPSVFGPSSRTGFLSTTAVKSRDASAKVVGEPSSSQMKLQPASQHRDLGLIRPSRQIPSKAGPSTPRSLASHATAWTPRSVEPSEPAGTVLSFSEIQQLQLAQGNSGAKDKTSLLKIQEEEKARRLEEDFLKWWSTQEQRMKVDSEETNSSRETVKGGKEGSGGQKSKQPPGKHRHGSRPARRKPGVAASKSDS